MLKDLGFVRLRATMKTFVANIPKMWWTVSDLVSRVRVGDGIIHCDVDGGCIRCCIQHRLKWLGEAKVVFRGIAVG